jgi:hypothetical protein
MNASERFPLQHLPQPAQSSVAKAAGRAVTTDERHAEMLGKATKAFAEVGRSDGWGPDAEWFV